MALHQLQPGCGQAPMQIINFREFNARQIFEALQNERLLDLAGGNLLVAMFTRLQRQIIRGNGKPEAGIIHWLQPLFHIVNKPKFSHCKRLAKPDSRAQIFRGKGA